MNESCSDARFVRLLLGSRWRDAVVLQTLFLFVFLLAGIANAQVKPVRRVLIIHEVGAYLPLSDYFDRGWVRGERLGWLEKIDGETRQKDSTRR